MADEDSKERRSVDKGTKACPSDSFRHQWNDRNEENCRLFLKDQHEEATAALSAVAVVVAALAVQFACQLAAIP